MATLWIQNGAIRANNTVYATLLNSGSTFSGFNIKCNAIKGTYTGGILTLNIPAEFVLGPSFSISPMIANITGTINITLT
jgi:hypothetical protein